MKLKVGDRVIRRSGSYQEWDKCKIGQTGIVHSLNGGSNVGIVLDHDGYLSTGHSSEYLELVSNKGNKVAKGKNKMSQLNDVPKRLAKVLKPGQTVTYQLGYLNSDLNPTDRGHKALKEMLWDKHVIELEKLAIAEVKQIMKDEKNDTK